MMRIIAKNARPEKTSGEQQNRETIRYKAASVAYRNTIAGEQTTSWKGKGNNYVIRWT